MPADNAPAIGRKELRDGPRGLSRRKSRVRVPSTPPFVPVYSAASPPAPSGEPACPAIEPFIAAPRRRGSPRARTGGPDALPAWNPRVLPNRCPSLPPCRPAIRRPAAAARDASCLQNPAVRPGGELPGRSGAAPGRDDQAAAGTGRGTAKIRAGRAATKGRFLIDEWGALRILPVLFRTAAHREPPDRIQCAFQCSTSASTQSAGLPASRTGSRVP